MPDQIPADPTATVEGTQAVRLQAQDGSRLAELHARYDVVKTTADAAAEQLKALTDAIKLELTQQAPDCPKVELTGPAGPTLRLSYSESWRVDAKKLKAEDPETYVRYAAKSGRWSLSKAPTTPGGDQ